MGVVSFVVKDEVTVVLRLVEVGHFEVDQDIILMPFYDMALSKCLASQREMNGVDFMMYKVLMRSQTTGEMWASLDQNISLVVRVTFSF